MAGISGGSRFATFGCGRIYTAGIDFRALFAAMRENIARATPANLVLDWFLLFIRIWRGSLTVLQDQSYVV
jgi:hypothetical protein